MRKPARSTVSLLLPVALMMAMAGTCAGQERIADPSHVPFLDEAQAGEPSRGTLTVGYQMQHTQGLIIDGGSVRGDTTTDAHIVFVAVDYLLDDHWQVHAELPFIRKRSSGGPGAHDPSILTVPHPEAEFLDDGNYHGALQDWVVGVSYHTHWGPFAVEPHLIVTLPSHDYSHFANAGIGQNLWRIKVGVDFSHRLESSNFYYTAGYSYEVWEQVLGINLDKQHFRATAGYFFGPKVAGWIFVNGRLGNGLGSTEIGTDRTTEVFYQHDRIAEHNFVLGGLGANYRINDRYSISVTGGKMLWGRNVHELKYAYDLALVRSF